MLEHLLSKRKTLFLWLLFASALLMPMLLTRTEGGGFLSFLSVWNFLALFVLCLLFWISRALVTLLVLQPFINVKISLRRMTALELVVNFCNVCAPFAGGGMIVAVLLGRHHDISMAKVSAVLIISKFIDLFFLLLFLVVAMVTSLNYFIFQEFSYLTTTIITLGAVSLVAVWSFLMMIVSRPKPFLAVIFKIITFLGVGEKKKRLMAIWFFRVRKCLRLFSKTSLSRKLLIFTVATLHWTIAATTLWVAVSIAGGEIRLEETVTVQVVAAIAAKLTFLPGGALVSEISAASILVSVVGAGVAGASIFLWRGVMFYLPLLFGLCCCAFILKNSDVNVRLRFNTKNRHSEV